MNSNLHKAKTAKNDEFYTRLEDIEQEVKHYIPHFEGKIVYLNCDDHRSSNFYTFFAQNFRTLKLKKLIATHFCPDGECSYKLEITGDTNGDGKVDQEDTVKTQLKGNGDFRSTECVALLKESDIVVTNPPFSLFREFIAQLMKHNKKFLVIGATANAVYKEIFPYIQNTNLWLGSSKPKIYEVPATYDGNKYEENGKWWSKHGNHCWFTNMHHHKLDETFYSVARYEESKYPKYENFNAIEVGRVVDIPNNYFGIMGVPLAFLEKINPEQFEIIWQSSGNTRASAPKDVLKRVGYEKHKDDRGGCPILNGKRKYTRLLIKRIENASK